ncbi:hypothetical protein NFHSH190041_20240 [Shewanella sp. NFH-SH190041]|uniref:J517_1871 family lipoprotein n=1 Tax=Shewanella sp. NFH-SH190041 TaxID=2950245 RepID=UPI0021C3F41E|nr:J517_1871 family lipoprotein [Shewanella sp. NFH-SH190041]BDM64572.1 hypothetical protein NFHSH190041_20240 [Shewanella sp. NFH-SH190041]
MIKPAYLAALLSMLLAGCASPFSDMLNNKFMNVVQTPQPNLAGLWTGTMGPYLVTMQINPNGSGVSCYEYNGTGGIQRLKVSSDTVFMQDGTKVTVAQKGGQLEVSVPYLGGGSYKFVPDNELAQASLFCADKLK